MRGLLLTICALVLAAPLQSQSRIDQTRAFGSSGSLRVMVFEGAVRVRGWDRDSVRVTGTISPAALSGFYFTPVVQGAAKIGIEAPQGGSADLEISVPRGTTLWIKTNSAPISVANVGGPLDLYTVSGDISVEGSPRSLHAESMAGSVQVVGSPRLARLKTGSGDMALRGAGVDVGLSTVSGRITLHGDQPLVRLRVETVSGPVHLLGSLQPGTEITINSHDGPVDFAVPASSGADFLLVTLQGKLLNELTRSAARKSVGLKGQELAFRNGNGGAEVTVRTFSGAVTVRPLDGP